MTQTTTQPAPSRSKPGKPLFEVADLAVSFHLEGGQVVHAVNGVSMSIYPRQTLAVVGESGCGKSVTAMSSMQLIPRPPGRFDRGTILFEGRNLLSLTEKQMLNVRGKDIAMIFQEPMTSLNPVYTIGDQILEAIFLHQDVEAKSAVEIAVQAMTDVGIPDPRGRLQAYPHQFSGGMRQRVMIAMALACQPKLLLADEPTTALDVTIQAQILDLLRDLQRKRDMGMMLITHDLGVVAENADVVCVMYAGRVVEYAKIYDLFDKCYHPYTRGLLRSIPKLHEKQHRLITVDQVVNDPNEFTKLPGHEHGVTPWWPGMTPPRDLAKSPEGDEYMLYEIEPEHWVGCWRTEYLESHPTRRPVIDYRKDDLGESD
ncbi:MAG: ABC transporter ATP-binding protein [Phycisphaerales bacterium]|nr:MAG: ABC transporter ATP-binding protein [Phycisphaerales bacterium]